MYLLKFHRKIPLNTCHETKYVWFQDDAITWCVCVCVVVVVGGGGGGGGGGVTSS